MRPDHRRFLEAFEACDVANHEFRHREHLLMAWLYLRRDGRRKGTESIVASIKRFAAAKGAADKYNETETLFWACFVDHVIATHPEVDDFEALAGRVPHMLDKTLPLRHYRRETIRSARAKKEWVEPDLVPLPF